MEGRRGREDLAGNTFPDDVRDSLQGYATRDDGSLLPAQEWLSVPSASTWATGKAGCRIAALERRCLRALQTTSQLDTDAK